ncbi:MAG: bifunctional methylenetetrahydrofolate dehydrogenase/methenyltetrahydrofolate cyclohydrolase FolD [Candidatus Peregrinibacteria bacterium]|nr:bifunctional methylenetetrahydrofolate dehydrogenase/methenyltetrahydrofolate cyclohydrolase FolD [Candidatus Peregrinibacteria bacterium]MDZ4244810.1 bifunctional methylenetetrahydrofolate dehydrogenase/methenyltetrahydrofolate cyclohydrolase FolD [Candidatus Gracilibacteria bacterium]
MELLDGKIVSQKVLEQVKETVDKLKKDGVKPKLAVILVGNNPASLSYIKQKRKACEFTGIEWEQIDYEESITQDELIKKIHQLNEQKNIHGLLVQLPLPDHIYAPEVIKAINPHKDVDGFHAYNLGKMFLSVEFEELAPCTPMGVIKLLDEYNIDVAGMDATVVGASNIVGKPMSIMLLNREATVTTCHIKTKDLKTHTLNADLLVVAVGKAGLITADMVKEGAVVVDVGCNKVDGKLCGDVDFDAISKKAGYITPVPGGCGPMTVACLMENTVIACERLQREQL